MTKFLLEYDRNSIVIPILLEAQNKTAIEIFSVRKVKTNCFSKKKDFYETFFE
jgi:hypothetical protein